MEEQPATTAPVRDEEAGDPQRTLRDSDALFRQLADQAPVPMRMSGPGKSCVWFNKRWLAFTGRSMAEERGAGWAGGVHPDEVDACLKIFSDSFDAREEFEMEYRLRRHDGSYRWLLEHGAPRYSAAGEFFGYIGSCVDITGRRETEDRLRESEQNLMALVESATEFAIMSVNASGRVESWSDGAERIFGFSEDEIMGQWMGVLFTPADRVAKVPEIELQRALATGRSFDDRWHVRKDGSLFWANGAASPIRGSSPTKFVKIARDLTERKQMEDALKEADRRKNEFLATLAHELRNPLAPIRSGLDLIRRVSPNSKVVPETLKIVERQTNQIVHLVDDLLDIARITQGKIRLKKERMDLREIVKMALETCHQAHESPRHEVRLDLPGDPVWLEADPVRIEQVLLNILNNAIKYTPGGGPIDIQVFEAEDEAVVRVKDTGIGIPAGRLDEVFTMFSQIETAGLGVRSGLGIGLSVVKGLVELHGGSVAVRSEGEGKGSEFQVRLPLIHAQNPAGREPWPHPRPLAEQQTKRILVIDDNVDAAVMLQSLLMLDGHEVEVAFDGERGLAAVENFRPHVCLCDIGLPGIDGYAVARQLRSTHPAVHLISISGWGQDEDRERSREAGFSAHLVKPVRAEEVTELLG